MSPKILVVEDEECVRDLLRETLEGEGCEVVTARTGAEALELVEAAEFDCLFTDINMPGMDGWQLARSVRERLPDIPLAVITGLGEAVSSAEREAAGANWVITKPFDLGRIAQLASELSNAIQLA